MKDVIEHYDLLVDEGNDPVHDSQVLRDYMDKWDGQRFLDSLCLDGAQSVLEIGVGTGRLAARVAPRCRRLCGIDISPKTVWRASENLSLYSNVSLVGGDFMTFDFDERFDVIYSSLTFMHIQDTQSAIQKVASLLRDDGRFVLSLDKSRDAYIDMGTRKIKIYPDRPDDIRRYMEQAGLTVIDGFETEHAYVLVCDKKNREA